MRMFPVRPMMSAAMAAKERRDPGKVRNEIERLSYCAKKVTIGLTLKTNPQWRAIQISPRTADIAKAKNQ